MGLPGAAGCSTTNVVGAYAVTKTDSAGAGTTVALGQSLTYTLSISNIGHFDYPSIAITDNAADVLDDATYVSGSAGITRSGNTIVWTGALPQTNNASNPVVATYVVHVDNPIPATGNGVLNNVVTGGQAGGNCPGARSCAVSNSTGGYTIVKTSSVANGHRSPPGRP